MSEFEREYRYTIIKIKDIEKYLSYKQKQELESILFQIRLRRARDERPRLKCVVVEDDWPEYEKVWDMLEERMKNE